MKVLPGERDQDFMVRQQGAHRSPHGLLAFEGLVGPHDERPGPPVGGTIRWWMPRHLDPGVPLVREQRLKPRLTGEGPGAGAESAAGLVERLVLATSPPGRAVLNPAAALVEGVTGEPDDVGRDHRRNRAGQLLADGGPAAGEPDPSRRPQPVSPGPDGLGGFIGRGHENVSDPGADLVTDCQARPGGLRTPLLKDEQRPASHGLP